MTNCLVTLQIIIVEDRPFVFDYVLGPQATQHEIYQTLVDPLVEKMLAGFHCTVLAYGQSGNGKTYTMGLHSTMNDNEEQAGIVIRTLREINRRVKVEDDKVQLAVSFIEIYNEKVFDLLSDNQTEPLSVKGSFKNSFKRCEINSEADAQMILYEASLKRHFRPTKINSSSSRSHAVFTIYAKIKSSDMCTINSEFNLVDLAGAEGVRKTGHHGVALTEGVNINQGLLSVGRVLQAITKGEKVIPYRESTLTRVLQESLNRNCYLTLLACISPTLADSKETLNTLRFAENVGTLKNDPKINVIINEITMARRKTPTKQVFTPFTARKLDSSKYTFQTLKKKSLNFLPSARKTLGPKVKVVEPLIDTTIHKNVNLTLPDTYRPTDDFSMFAPNISTSTFINPGLNDTNFSPVLRRYMNTFEDKLEAKISTAFEEMAKNLMETTMLAMTESRKRKSSTPKHDDSILKRSKMEANFSYLKSEIQNIIRTELEPLKSTVDSPEFKRPVPPRINDTQLDTTFDLEEEANCVGTGEMSVVSTPLKKTTKNNNVAAMRRSKRIASLNESGRNHLAVQQKYQIKPMKSNKGKKILGVFFFT